MTSDRELLELAAKAAGITFIKWVEDVRAWLCETNDGTPRYFWNPLDYDGDALRLAVALNIDLMHDTGVGGPGQSVTFPLEGDYEALTEHHAEGDKQSATRRAIVRAAAEIGRATA